MLTITKGAIPSMSECDPGLKPTGFSVLIAPASTESKTKGGIILTDDITGRDKAATVRGRLISVSPVAFDFANWPEGTEPKPGDAVYYAKFAGMVVEGRDGKEYRVCLDKDVAAIIEEDEV